MIRYEGPLSVGNAPTGLGVLAGEHFLVLKVFDTLDKVWWHCFLLFPNALQAIGWLQQRSEYPQLDQDLETKLRLGWRPLNTDGRPTPGGYVDLAVLDGLTSGASADSSG